MTSDVYAWVSADRTGTVGIMSVNTGLGIAPAAFGTRKIAEMFRGQAQMRADELGLEVELLHYTNPTKIDSVSPRRN